MITWSRAQSVKRLDGWWSFIINAYLSKFGSHNLRRSGYISVFCHVTSCDHVIVGSRNFADCGLSTSLTSMPSAVPINLVEVEIWYILIFNARRRTREIMLLQSGQCKFAGFFDIFCVTKCGKVVLLQSVTDRYYKVRQVLKVWQTLLQSVSGITNCDSY